MADVKQTPSPRFIGSMLLYGSIASNAIGQIIGYYHGNLALRFIFSGINFATVIGAIILLLRESRPPSATEKRWMWGSMFVVLPIAGVAFCLAMSLL